jgi:hypothetical protein
MLLDPATHTLHISSDEGSTFHPAPNIPAGSIHKLVIHPFGHNMAFALGKGEEHWVSYDRGESWLKWSLGVEGRGASLGGDTLGFHAEKSGESRVLKPRMKPLRLLNSMMSRGRERIR